MILLEYDERTRQFSRRLWRPSLFDKYQVELPGWVPWKDYTAAELIRFFEHEGRDRHAGAVRAQQPLPQEEAPRGVLRHEDSTAYMELDTTGTAASTSRVWFTYTNNTA